MLTITDNAGLIVSDIVNRAVTTDTGGLRIAEAPHAQFSVSIAEAPAESDVIAEHGAARVFMDEPAAEVLSDKVLDARLGDDGGVEFLIAQRDE